VDEQALAQIGTITSREVVPVSSAKVCAMGGGVRSMFWQLRGVNAARLLAFLNK